MKKFKSQLTSLIGLSVLAGSISSCGVVPGLRGRQPSHKVDWMREAAFIPLR
ncbi:hypothetical protein IQ255_17560 [Pleurocapsales cyanobacterium LEGE 10410]|nr:hypothetical protein [Pleurocapsales cyanobacterium LEGE 10410]